MAAIFPPESTGGVPPGPSAPNSYIPTNAVIGEGPLYASSDCSTMLTADQVNGQTSEILAAVDRLGVAYNSALVTNLGDALIARFDATLGPEGGTMTGPLILSGDPTVPNQAATKSYVDVADGLKVAKSGDSMTGFLTLNADPTNAMHAATRQYVLANAGLADSPHDGTTYGRNNGAWVAVVGGGGAYVPLAGGTMTGPLVLWGNPIANLDAAPKQYVDLRLALAGGTMTGPLTLAAAPTVANQAATKAYVDGLVSSAIAAPSPPQGRLTLQSGVPVMTTTQAAKTSIIYTPYRGNACPIYNGTNFLMQAFAEVSQATTDTSKSPAAVVANSVYDIFGWMDGPTFRISRGPPWTSATARSAGTVLAMVNGILLNSVAITNGPGAQRGTYLGTVRSNASAQIDWIYGALANGGTAGVFALWNAYNRVKVASLVADANDSWTYGTAVYRSVNGSANMRHSFVCGLAEDAFSARYSSISDGDCSIAIGFDVTNARSGTVGYIGNLGGGSTTAIAQHSTTALGFHFFQALEAANLTATGSSNFYGDDGAFVNSGLSFEGLM